MELFGKNIQFLRKKSGFTQSDMTKHIDVTRVTWCNYEKNVSEPDLAKLTAIAKLFGVTADQLISVDLADDVNLNNNFSQYLKERQIINNENNLTIPIQKKQNKNKGNIDVEILNKLNDITENIELLKKGLL